MLVHPQIPLLQGLRQNGQAEERGGNHPLYIRANNHDPNDNQHNAGQAGQDHGQADLPHSV